VPGLLWEQLETVRRHAAAHTAVWEAKGPLVYQGFKLLAEFRGSDAKELAALAAAEHNLFIELVNALQMLGRKLADAKANAAESVIR
jgi:hypothetical protein